MNPEGDGHLRLGYVLSSVRELLDSSFKNMTAKRIPTRGYLGSWPQFSLLLSFLFSILFLVVTSHFSNHYGQWFVNRH